MTYAELAKARRIDKASAVKLAMRKGWQRGPVGDGSNKVHVLVPEDMLEPGRRAAEAASLRSEVMALRQDVARIIERLDRVHLA
jgi:hypothetical protein